MNAKYEFVEGDEKEIAPGVVLKRIRALVAISATLFSPAVAPGELGGYIQQESNLEVSDNAWVYGDARVYGNAQVYGDARVSDNAQVSDNAWVYGDARVSGNAQVSDNAWVHGDARVSGNAQVYGDAWVSGNAQVYGDARVYGDGLIFWASKVGTENGTLTVYNAKDNALLVTRGCFLGTPAEFLAKSASEHDERIHREYSLLIEVATSRIEAARAELGDQA